MGLKRRLLLYGFQAARDGLLKDCLLIFRSQTPRPYFPVPGSVPRPRECHSGNYLDRYRSIWTKFHLKPPILGAVRNCAPKLDYWSKLRGNVFWKTIFWNVKRQSCKKDNPAQVGWVVSLCIWFVLFVCSFSLPFELNWNTLKSKSSTGSNASGILLHIIHILNGEHHCGNNNIQAVGEFHPSRLGDSCFISRGTPEFLLEGIPGSQPVYMLQRPCNWDGYKLVIVYIYIYVHCFTRLQVPGLVPLDSAWKVVVFWYLYVSRTQIWYFRD